MPSDNEYIKYSSTQSSEDDLHIEVPLIFIAFVLFSVLPWQFFMVSRDLKNPV